MVFCLFQIPETKIFQLNIISAQLTNDNSPELF